MRLKKALKDALGGGDVGLADLSFLRGDYQQADAPTGLSLVRVEIGAGRFTGKARIAVRSNDHLVARGLCECILMRIAEGAHA